MNVPQNLYHKKRSGAFCAFSDAGEQSENLNEEYGIEKEHQSANKELLVDWYFKSLCEGFAFLL